MLLSVISGSFVPFLYLLCLLRRERDFSVSPEKQFKINRLNHWPIVLADEVRSSRSSSKVSVRLCPGSR